MAAVSLPFQRNLPVASSRLLFTSSNQRPSWLSLPAGFSASGERPVAKGSLQLRPVTDRELYSGLRALLRPPLHRSCGVCAGSAGVAGVVLPAAPGPRSSVVQSAFRGNLGSVSCAL